jgi:hypothetical protein
MPALPNVSKEPHVWLGDIGQVGDNAEFSAFEPTLREFVVKAKTDLKGVKKSDRIYPWPKLRLALNFVGSGHGGAAGKKGQLAQGLVTTLHTLAVDHDVDIILVTRGEKPYAAAQWARRRVLNDADLSKTWQFGKRTNRGLIKCARRLADAAIESQLVLFIGAGVSAGAPIWGELLTTIARKAGLSRAAASQLAAKDPRDQGTLIERRLKESGRNLKSEVAEELRGLKRYSLQHGLLASLPSSEAVTTNFDSLFEAASRAGGRDLGILPERPRTNSGRWLLKLHGSSDMPENIVLTRSDFLDMPRKYGALMGLVQGMLLMRHMVFVGYSLQDEDFQELLHEVRAARGGGANREGRGTVLTLFEDALDREIWADDLDVIPMVAGARDLPPHEEAARELEIFLDLVSYLSTTSAAFFLDKTYKSLSDDEGDLRESLISLAAVTRDAKKGSVGYVVQQFLQNLGGAAVG